MARGRRFGHSEESGPYDLNKRLLGTPTPPPTGTTGRPASVMDALHERISEIAEMTRSSLAVHAGILDEVLERVAHLEDRVVESALGVQALTESVNQRLGEILARLEEQQRAAGGASRPVVDLLSEERAGAPRPDGSSRRWARSP